MTKPAPRKLAVGRFVHLWVWEGHQLVPCPVLVLVVGDDGAKVWGQVFHVSGGIWPQWVPAAPFGEDGLQAPTEGHWTWPKVV